MKYAKLGKSDINVSKLALGTWALGGGGVWSDRESDVEGTKSLLDACSDLGINYLDTAPVYGMGRSEELLGQALKGRRDKFIVQSKCSLNWRGEGGMLQYQRDGYTVNRDTRPAAIRKDVDEILKRMDLEYLDSLIVHYITSKWPVSETAGVLEDLIKEGKIRAYGISNSQPGDLEYYCLAAGEGSANGGASLVQEFFSVLSPFHGRDYFDVCSKYGASFQTYGVLEEGFLTGPAFLDREFKKTDIRARIPWYGAEYKAELRKVFELWKPLLEKYGCSYANLAQAWALKQYDNMSLLVGMRTPKSAEDSAKAFDIALTDEDAAFMENSVKHIQVEVLDK